MNFRCALHQELPTTSDFDNIWGLLAGRKNVTDRSINTSKRLASQRQIEAAIQHYNNDAWECAVTLAHAAENCIAKPGIVSFFERLKETIPINHNELPVWLKHGGGPESRPISELDVIVIVQRAISKFAARFNGITQTMRSFSDAQREKLGAAGKA
jgi:hypothetical protein